MPTDVPLGAGYVGAILDQRFPNQYRDPRTDVQTFDQGYYQFPGGVSGQPRFTDPDRGREMVLQNIPGIGQVVVPVEHIAPNMGQVVNVEQRMASMSQFAQQELQPFQSLIRSLNLAARSALDDAQRYGKDTLTAKVQSAAEVWIAQNPRRPVEPPVVREAVTAVLKALAPKIQQALRVYADQHGGQRGQGDWQSSMFGFAGMGGLSASLAQLTAGADLDKLNISLDKMMGSISDAYRQVDAVKEASKDVDQLASLGGGFFAPTQGRFITFNEWASGAGGPGAFPMPQGIAFLQAKKAVVEAYNHLTAFDYMTNVFSSVFTPLAAGLRPVYDGIDGLLQAISHWHSTWRTWVYPVAGQADLWNAIQAEHMKRWAAAMGAGSHVDFDNPTYLTTAQDAIQAVTGVSVTNGGTAGMGDFGITALIAVIIAAVIIISIVIGAVSIVKELNVKVVAIHEERMAYDAQQAKEREQFMAGRTAEGASFSQAQAEWDARKQASDAEQQKKEKQIQETPGAGDVFAGAGKYVAIAAAAVGAVVVLPHLLGGLGLL